MKKGRAGNGVFFGEFPEWKPEDPNFRKNAIKAAIKAHKDAMPEDAGPFS